jgi:hypothetical protein
MSNPSFLDWVSIVKNVVVGIWPACVGEVGKRLTVTEHHAKPKRYVELKLEGSSPPVLRR